MPRRDDIGCVLILGAGPIVIGQACEFDYSGTQACRALREEGYRVVLVNSNPATIMTDPDTAESTYVDAVEWRTVAEVIRLERPDALLPTMGGQTALNCALDLAREGVLERFGVELIGASREAIDKAEDRLLFAESMRRIGLKTPRCGGAHSLTEAVQVQAAIGFPCVIRSCFTLGGSGGGIAYNQEQFQAICREGLERSPTHEILIDESLIGWKEYELEVVRDLADNCIIVCSIENLDPMGVHTGDSITVAPVQTLTDKEYQRMRNAAIAILREIGVETGGANVQFAVNPADGDLVVIEMNPRVSRSSALASKATGFPIAKVAAKLAVGYRLDELSHTITGQIPASFEPTLDYVVTKIPRFAFEKFPHADPYLNTQMKSIGEVMAIGRTFQESLQKALCSLETGISGLDPMQTSTLSDGSPDNLEIIRGLQNPNADRLRFLADAVRHGISLQAIHTHSHIDPWYVAQVADLVAEEQKLHTVSLDELDHVAMWRLKRKGFSDRRLADVLKTTEDRVRGKRHDLDVRPVYKRIDTCAAEFPTQTAYMYSTYEQECEAKPSQCRKIMVLGGGPNRIGQGIEFDYCCVHAVLAIREQGCETIMVNCNPETVSTDYDTSDRLYFEPVTLEHVLEILHLEKPSGVIVQFGGQTPLQLSQALTKAGVPIIGTSADAIDRAENRQRFRQLLSKLGLRQPANRTANGLDEALAVARELRYPLIARPSYVLGGRAMQLVYSDADLRQYMLEQIGAGSGPVLLERYLAQAVEVDIDLVSDGREAVVGGIMQHVEQAGVHSGDSACSLPPYTLDPAYQEEIREQVRTIALELGVIGLMNAQMAVQNQTVYVLEVNPRASRTVPFVSKSIGVSLARIGALCMLGDQNLRELQFTKEIVPQIFFAKESVLPFMRFAGVDPILGPEMKSTGEVMGMGDTFAEAFARAIVAGGGSLPDLKGPKRALLSVRDSDKPGAVAIAQELLALGFILFATRGTAERLRAAGIQCEQVNKVLETRPDISDLLKNRQIDLIVNTTEGHRAIADSAIIRRLALDYGVCYTTTLTGGAALCMALRHGSAFQVRRLQDLHARTFKCQHQ